MNFAMRFFWTSLSWTWRSLLTWRLPIVLILSVSGEGRNWRWMGMDRRGPGAVRVSLRSSTEGLGQLQVNV